MPEIDAGNTVATTQSKIRSYQTDKAAQAQLSKMFHV